MAVRERIIFKPVSVARRDPIPVAEAPDRLLRAVMLAYTAFCAVMIPVYLVDYGPTNFLYFCDLAILLVLAGLWASRPLLVSMAAVGIIVPQSVWILDFTATAMGHPLVGITAYMFDPGRPLFLRALSSFHGWLPLLLVFLVARTGYDKRAMACWTALATAALAASFFLMPPPSLHAGSTPVNINYVFGPSDAVAQQWMPAWAWASLLAFGLPLFATLPTHLLLRRFFEKN